MKKFLNQPVVQVIILAVVSYLLGRGGLFLGSFVYYFLQGAGNDVLTFMGLYGKFIGTWIVIFLFWLIVKKYRCLFSELGPKAKGNKLSTSLLIGLVFGLGLNLAVAAVAMLNGDIKLSFNEVNIAYIIGFIIAVGIQSGAEELLVRVHVYQNLRRIFPAYPAVAIIGNALFFSAIHLNNSGITVLALFNILIVGVLYSLIVYYYDSFWGAVAAHTGWNFCQSILLGLPNSGFVSAYSVFTLDAASATNSFAYDVTFGVEGTVVSTVIQIIACIVVYVTGKRRNQEPLDVWNCQGGSTPDLI